MEIHADGDTRRWRDMFMQILIISIHSTYVRVYVCVYMSLDIRMCVYVSMYVYVCICF